MDNLFKDLEGIGISGVEDINLFEDGLKKDEKPKISIKVKDAEAIIYQRKVTCPVCNKLFMTSSIRTGRIRFVDTELDLRPIYNGFDPIPYDVVVCTHCGYAGLNKFFLKVSEFKAKIIKTKISVSYNGKEYPKVFTYEQAIQRYKLALLNSVVGHDSNGMKAYLCLKISWLFRGWQEQLREEGEIGSKRIKELKSNELIFVRKAFEGFLIAYECESFPIVGIEQDNLEYLISELARRLGEFDETRKWLSRVIQRQNTNKRLNDKIFQVKELMNKGIMT